METKSFVDELVELKEKVERYEKALKEIRKIPWENVHDTTSIAHKALENKG